MNLADLPTKDSAYITRVKGRGAFRKRIIEMGFVKGQKVTSIKNAPLKDPIEYKVMGYKVSLRRSEAQLIEIFTKEEAIGNNTNQFNGVISDTEYIKTADQKQKTILVALVGNPNAGKTSLYNYASHSKEHVGNYGGVTIDSRMARLQHKDYTFELTDLPGTYSISAYTPEELYVRKYIFGEMPDVVINVVDASNLERNLYLTTQLIDMDVKVVIALNMFDELQKSGDEFDYVSLGKMIGIPIVPTVALKGKGLKELFDKVIDVFEDREPDYRHIHINYGIEPEVSINRIQEAIWKNKKITDKVSSRYYAIKLLEKDRAAEFSLSRWENYDQIESVSKSEIERIEKITNDDTEALITDSRYGFISGGLKETYVKNKIQRRNNSEIIDAFLTNKIFGFPFLFIILFVAFYATFEIGKYPMHWLEELVSFTSLKLSNVLPEGPLTDLIIDGILGGVGSVIVFLPNILILFFFISLMEDTGYMSRAAFIMDKIMHKIGLHGRSFIPLIMGFGCNVPAIMATRTIKNRNNRLVTILINPFMSCSARLPVYILIIGAFFPSNAGLVLFLIYAFGIFMAASIAILFKKVIFKSEEVPFVMELPPYRVPTLKSTVTHMWSKGGQYLKKMGGVILVASIIIWGLSYYPQDHPIAGEDLTGITNNIGEKQGLQNSYIGKVGKFIEPIMSPLGLDWKMSVGLLTGIAAKEVVVSTMGVLYQSDSESNGVGTITKMIKEEKYTEGDHKGEKVYNPVVATSFIIFILLYFPCVAVIAAIKKESGSWKWALFTIFYTTSLAWIMSFIVYQTGKLLFL